jgi:hypothetical protein
MKTNLVTVFHLRLAFTGWNNCALIEVKAPKFPTHKHEILSL